METHDAFDVVTHDGVLGIKPSNDDDRRFIRLADLGIVKKRVDEDIAEALC